ncbi:hypothetical protein [Lewinella sp. IMCC34183]|uniref:hypothetical protein n=1 Tax=Lewinella sp. IMCC34183 TaxID=2248762 RepID=UPI000E26573F|nr:hypothetical protein [Lewinella sp. IMCC34183]
MDKGSERRWENLNVALENYRLYLGRKSDDVLTLIDLLHISNFKGGNASITEPEAEIARKLPEYERRMDAIRNEFGTMGLANLSNQQRASLVKMVKKTLELSSNEQFCIRGFGPSYLSALLHAHFPDLIPIIDRRILINTRRVKRKDVNSQLQVKSIPDHVGPLISWFHDALQSGQASMRDLDRAQFIKPLDVAGLDESD